MTQNQRKSSLGSRPTRFTSPSGKRRTSCEPTRPKRTTRIGLSRLSSICRSMECSSLAGTEICDCPTTSLTSRQPRSLLKKAWTWKTIVSTSIEAVGVATRGQRRYKGASCRQEVTITGTLGRNRISPTSSTSRTKTRDSTRR